MIPLPENLLSAFNHFMVQRQVPPDQQPYFRKWLNYYVDFCHRYRHAYDQHSSLAAFHRKLTEKGHSVTSHQQAEEAITLYFDMLNERKIDDQKVCASKDNRAVKIANGADWRWLYDRLEEQIRVRHYSNSTFKCYRGWVRQLQNFLERFILITDDGFEPLVFEELCDELYDYQGGPIQSRPEKASSDSQLPAPQTAVQSERETIQQALESTGYHKTKTAGKLGISRTTLWKKMKKYSL